jgi:PKD repeat protein
MEWRKSICSSGNFRITILALVLVSLLCGMVLLQGFSSKPVELKNVTGTLNTSLNSTDVSLSSKADLPHITRTAGSLHLNATIYQNAGSLPTYRGIPEKNGSVNLQLKQIGKKRDNVTTEKEAPDVAKKVLEQYGGLPVDAVYDGASTSFSEYFTNGTLTHTEPVFTTVTYSRRINRLPVFGENNIIILTLGTDGELLWILKEWRNYSYAGDVPLISIDEATNKLENQDLIESSWHPEEGNVTIDSIGLGYYAKKTGNSETITEPLWLFFGAGESGSRLGFYVYARKFASFTTTPIKASRSEEITFRDTSDTSTTRRYWDFGDGTNSTLRNPVHVYQKTGTYTVNLSVWNDLGGDNVSKTMVITRDPR